MKNYFIINPIAGKGNGIEDLMKNIKETAHNLGEEAIIYVTKYVIDAHDIAKKIAMETASLKEKIRIFACGGDGTLNEVINGIIGYEHIYLGCLPIGSGNDYIRNYHSSKADFFNIQKQFNGEIIKTDVIKYSGIIDDENKTGYCVNMFNIGFDCNVVIGSLKFKKLPFFSGSMAYLSSVISNLISMQGTDISIKIDDKTVHNGKCLLCSIANGSFCGGGLKTSPQANFNDGIFDINIVNAVSRTKFLKLFPTYSKGTFLDNSDVLKIVKLLKCQKATLSPKNKEIALCVDGEIHRAGNIDFEIISNAINFISPQ